MFLGNIGCIVIDKYFRGWQMSFAMVAWNSEFYWLIGLIKWLKSIQK